MANVYNYFRDYFESDPIGLSAGLSTYAYVGSNPNIGIDATGEANSGNIGHRTGQWKDCGKGCRIRIDRNHGGGGRHLHWECKGKAGEMGEFGATSHGQNSGDAPGHVKECARKYGFEPEPQPGNSEKSSCGGTCTTVLGGLAVACGVGFCALQPELCALGVAGYALGR